MPVTPCNLAIADDHNIYRKVVYNYLSNQRGLHVIIQANNGLDLLAKLKTTPVDILLLDIYMPKLSGLEALKIIRRDFPEIRILLVSMCSDLELISELLDLGIYGYISKSDEPEELLLAIESVSNNRIYRNNMLTKALNYKDPNLGRAGKPPAPNILNDREKRILQLLWEEKDNREIADEVRLSVRSVEKLRLDMKEKVGVRSTIGLFKYGMMHHIIGQDFCTSNSVNYEQGSLDGFI